MRSRIIAVLMFGIATQVVSADITVYRWVDENNIVHFSQHQPSHESYTEITMTEALKAKAKEVEAVKPVEPPQKVEQRSVVKDRYAGKCAEAKSNVKTLLAFDKIQTTDDDSNVRFLTKQDKEKQLELSRKQVDLYCGE